MYLAIAGTSLDVLKSNYMETIVWMIGGDGLGSSSCNDKGPLSIWAYPRQLWSALVSNLQISECIANWKVLNLVGKMLRSKHIKIAQN